jgi:hypothetical protein
LSWNNENYINGRAPINEFGVLDLVNFNQIFLEGQRMMHKSMGKVNISATLLHSEVKLLYN